MMTTTTAVLLTTTEMLMTVAVHSLTDQQLSEMESDRKFDRDIEKIKTIANQIMTDTSSIKHDLKSGQKALRIAETKLNMISKTSETITKQVNSCIKTPCSQDKNS